MAISGILFIWFHMKGWRLMDLSRKRERDRLAPRPDCYWQQLAKGAYLGFRRGPDTWHARFRGRDKKQLYQPLGEALEYEEAKKRAEAWLSQLAGSPVRAVKRGTVIAALETYLADLRRQHRTAAAKKAEELFKTSLQFDRKNATYRDPLAGTQLEQASRDDFTDWRDRLEPGRLPRTVNRYVRAVVAGLNRAHELGHVGNPATWAIGSLTDDDESETAVFLMPAQRTALIGKASPEGAAFLRGLELSGARPKELAEATVADFDGERLKLSHRKGRPPKLRSRYVVLDAAGVEFFRSQAKDKTPADRLFMASGERLWRRDLWADEVRSAIAGHNESAQGDACIPKEASAYSFRHARISELLQVYGVDPLTVAAQTGTSLRMIERTYFKFIRSAMLEKLATLQARPAA
jgi:integrase